jgi:hypothetical protein
MSHIPRGAVPEATPCRFGPGLVDEDLTLWKNYRQRPLWIRPEDHAHMLRRSAQAQLRKLTFGMSNQARDCGQRSPTRQNRRRYILALEITYADEVTK